MEKTRVLWLYLVAALDEFAGETKKTEDDATDGEQQSRLLLPEGEKKE
jgi:hypothetical protein